MIEKQDLDFKKYVKERIFVTLCPFIRFRKIGEFNFFWEINLMGEWNFNVVAIIYFSAAGISFLLSYLSWRMRPARGAVYFSLMMLACAIWVSSYTLEIFNANLDWKILMFKFEFFGLASAVYLWWIFVVSYTQFDNWLNKFTIALMAVVPVFFLYNVFKAPEPSSVYSDFVLMKNEDIFILNKVRDAGFYIWTSWAYSTLALGMMLLIVRMINMPRRQRRQIFLIAPAVLLLIIPNFAHLLGKSPFYPYDPTPIALAMVGILFLISIYYHKFIEVMPVAHTQVLKNMRSGVVIIDSRNQIIELNQAAQAIFKFRQKDILGKSVTSIFSEFDKMVESSREEEDLKTEFIHEDSGRTFELKVNTIRDEKGEVISRVLLFFDITEQVKAINELDAYARTVAHDLKNPLNAISGHAQLLEVACTNKIDPEMKECLTGIQQGASHMNAIIDGLLLLAQVRNIDHVEVKKLDMQFIIKSSVDKLQSSVEEKNAEVKVIGTIFPAMGYSIWIEEVMTNLLSNAIKYGGDNPAIKIRSIKKGNKIIYSVADNGPGLSAEEQVVIFGEFARVSQHKSAAAGHGLGLSIVKRIVEKLGGEVGVTSQPGKGSKFYFSLPA